MEKESIIICYRLAAIQFDAELKSINLSTRARVERVDWWIITIYCAPNNLNAIFPFNIVFPTCVCVRVCVINVRHWSVTVFNAFKNCAPSTQKSHYSWSRLITYAPCREASVSIRSLPNSLPPPPSLVRPCPCTCTVIFSHMTRRNCFEIDVEKCQQLVCSSPRKNYN